MKSTSIKLCEVVEPSQLVQRCRGQTYALGNSLKRSRIDRPELPYETRLPVMRPSKWQLGNMLAYVLGKDTLEKADRNWIRRVLLQSFKEEMVAGGDRQFVQHLNLLEMKRGESMKEVKMFGWILGGVVRVTAGKEVYKASKGMVFGVRQILAEIDITKAECLSQVLLVYLTQQHFDLFFRKYFTEFYQKRREKLQPIDNYFSSIPVINQYMLLDEMLFQGFRTSQTIVQRCSTIDNVYFVGQSLKSEAVIQGAIGWVQLLREETVYRQGAFNSNKYMTIPYLTLKSVQRHLLRFTGEQKEAQMNRFSMFSALFQSCLGKKKPERQQRAMRVQKVRLSLRSHKMRTEPTEVVESKFKFFSKKEVKSPGKSGKERVRLRMHTSELVSRKAGV